MGVFLLMYPSGNSVMTGARIIGVRVKHLKVETNINGR